MVRPASILGIVFVVVADSLPGRRIFLAVSKWMRMVLLLVVMETTNRVVWLTSKCDISSGRADP